MLNEMVKTDGRGALYERVRISLERERLELRYLIDKSDRALLRSEAASEASNGGPDQEWLIDRGHQHRQRLKLVLQGLQRIRDGTFGLCATCDEPIGERRLLALPTARLCITCQQETELTLSGSSELQRQRG